MPFDAFRPAPKDVRHRRLRTAARLGVALPVAAVAIAACASTGGEAPTSTGPTTVYADALVASPGFYTGTKMQLGIDAGQLKPSTILGTVEAPIPALSKTGEGDTSGSIVGVATNLQGDAAVAIFAPTGTPSAEISKIIKAAQAGSKLTLIGTPETTKPGILQTELKQQLNDGSGDLFVLDPTA